MKPTEDLIKDFYKIKLEVETLKIKQDLSEKALYKMINALTEFVKNHIEKIYKLLEKIMTK